MTIREINRVLRDGEVLDGNPPMERLTGLIAVMRSAGVGQCASIGNVALGMTAFVEGYGPITTDSIDEFMKMPDDMLDIDIPNDLVLEYLGESEDDEDNPHVAGSVA